MKKIIIIIAISVLIMLGAVGITAAAETVATAEYGVGWSIYYYTYPTIMSEHNAHYVAVDTLYGLTSDYTYTLTVSQCTGLSIDYTGDYSGTYGTAGGVNSVSFAGGGIVLYDNAVLVEGDGENPHTISYNAGTAVVVIMSDSANTLTSFTATLDNGVEPDAVSSIIDALGATVRGFGRVLADAFDGAVGVVWDGTSITIYGALILVGVGAVLVWAAIAFVFTLISKIGGKPAKRFKK